MELKYKFNTLEEVKQAIEQWFIALGYDNHERAEKQYLKIISEVGEMADALCKEDIENFKSEAGDVFVTILGLCLQTKNNFRIYKNDSHDNINVINNIRVLNFSIGNFHYDVAIGSLKRICISQNTNLLECATIAYNKIQGRLERGELKIINGTVVKSGK